MHLCRLAVIKDHLHQNTRCQLQVREGQILKLIWVIISYRYNLPTTLAQKRLIFVQKFRQNNHTETQSLTVEVFIYLKDSQMGVKMDELSQQDKRLKNYWI